MVSLYTKLISGGASLLIQILLVVGGVLLFLFIDPFGITAPEKKTLKDTPVQVRSIKQLGELITAEYYGEVVASLGEVIDTITETQVDSFVEITDDLHEDFIVAIDELSAVPDLNKRSKPYETFYRNFDDVVKRENYASYVNFIFRSLMERTVKTRHLNDKLTKAQEKKLFRKLYKNSGGWRDELKKIETAEYASVFRQTVEKEVKRTFRKPKLAMIGRGWVKAGIDFESFDEDNFRYDKDQKVIHFIGLQPKIISATINPWFIPEQGVEGFQFLVAERKVKMRPDYVKKVKQQCLNKLEAQAHEKAILERSLKNAEDYLKNFFSLLVDDEIRRVVFHADHLQYSYSALMADNMIKDEEIFFIDSIIHHHSLLGKDSARVRNEVADFIGRIRKEGYWLNGKKTGLNPQCQRLYRILEDKTIDSRDSKLFSSVDTITELDSLWYSRLFLSRDTLILQEIDERIGLAETISGQDSTLDQQILNEGSRWLDSAMTSRRYLDRLWFEQELREALKDDLIGIDTLKSVPDSLIRKDPVLLLSGI